MFIRKPFRSPLGGGWVVIISENRSPRSKVIERIECTSREAAWEAYRHAWSERI